jgi:hypothetical protein
LPGPGILAFRTEAEHDDEYRRGGGWEAITHHRDREDGEHTMFRTVPGFVNAYNYHMLVEIDPPSDAETHEVDIVVGEERIEVPLVIVCDAGHPGQVYYSNESSDRGPFSLVTSSNGRLENGTIRFFPGETGRITQARSRDYKYAGWTFVEPTDESATLKLVESATVRGRVLRADGTPLAGAELRTPYKFDPSKEGQFPSQPEVGYYPSTDEEGRFEFIGLPADLPLRVHVDIVDRAANRLLDRRYLFTDLTLEVGETRDLGELRFSELRKPERQ